MRTALACLSAAFLCLALPGVAGAEPSAKDIALVRALKAQTLTRIEFKETNLEGVVKWLRVATGKNIIIKQSALAKAGIEWQDLSYTVELEKVSVWTFLEDVIAKPYDMALTVRGNIVFLTSRADSHGKPVTKLYTISHITWTKTDFFGPSINLNPSGFVGEEYEPEKPVENDPLTSGDAVAELIKELLVPAQWEENDDWAIRATDRYLVIRAPKSVHALIPRALEKIASMK
ncbi:MAG: hypothetical protein O2894_01865 [Planctomycetota bacterium]|nr:hypothetical protein [Planctomycetota bacterium]